MKKAHREQQEFRTILLIALIGFLGTSLPYPIFPPLFLEYSFIDGSTAQKTFFLGLALAAYPFGQFAGSPILGGISDRYSRRSVLLWSLILASLGYALSALSIIYHSFSLLLISRFFTGFMEGNIAIARAMASDLSTISKYKSFGKINFTASLGFIIGPLLGGFLSSHHLFPWFSFALPFWVAAILSAIAFGLAIFKIPNQKDTRKKDLVSIRERFRFILLMRQLFAVNPLLKHLLLASTFFTLAVDTFYQFGPVFLTATWKMGPLMIAFYNAALCAGLASAAWLPHYLSSTYSLEKTIFYAEILTAFILCMLVVTPHPVIALIAFSLIGFCITTVTTNLTVQVSLVSDEHTQGQAFGTQVGLRTFCDGTICVTGGFLAVFSAALPLKISAFIAFFAAFVYRYGKQQRHPESGEADRRTS